jgi:arylsulfatase A-like enzyme
MACPALPRLALALSLLPLLSGCAQGPANATGVILVSIDTLRPDHLGCYGYAPPTSPHVDAVCREAVVFDQALSHAPSTLLSHASLFTSRIPQHHGASHVRRLAIRADAPTLAEMYRRAGWRTAGFYGGAQLAAEFGFDRGFEVYAVRDVPFTALVPEALSWLAGLRGDEPFFLFLHTFQVHHPYEPAAASLRRFEPRYSGQLPPTIGVDLLAAANEGRLELDDADSRHIVAAYDAEIREMDAGVGTLLAALRRSGLLRRSLLVLTSDHGEEFGEHGFMGWHSHTLFQELLRVPLILRLPGEGGAALRVADRVQLLDVAPTLLAASGVAGPDLEGVSLLPLLSSPGGVEEVSLRRRLAGRPHIALAETTQVRVDGILLGRWKLIDNRLFDLRDDPAERIDLSVAARPRAAHLRALLAVAHGAASTPGAPVSLDGETETALRALGYLTGDRQ